MRLVHELVNGAGLTPGSVAGSGAGGGGRIMGVEAGVHNKLAEIWGFAKSDRERFDEGSWVDGSEERMWKPSLRIRLSRWRSG